MSNLIAKIKKYKIYFVFLFIGFLTFFSGLSGAFQNDDFYQIVNNEPVHSISNLPSFFANSTFYNGEKLTGVYYRPLMTTTFSIIYSLFGPNPLAYHLIQLLIHISGAFVLFLVLKTFISPIMSFILSAIFLVHPLNSQIVFSIPTMQDALFFFFGVSAIYYLINSKSMPKVVVFLSLALLSKESGILFTLIAFIYLVLFNRKNIIKLLKAISIPVLIYALLRINAVGISGAHSAAPINELGLVGRIFTAPSVFLFYIGKFVFPEKLSLGYYWTYPEFSIENVLVPLVIGLLIVCVFVVFGFVIKRKQPKDVFNAYLFFSLWTIMGVGLYMQIIPGLDFTACETWFYFAMAGLLGMIGIIAKLAAGARLNRNIVYTICVIAIIAFGIRSNIRGYDYQSQYKLATVDISVSPDNFAALNNIAQYLIRQNQFNEAIEMSQKSINIYPIVSNYINLGVALQQTGRYDEALLAYDNALKHGNINIIYENLALIHIVHSKPTTVKAFFDRALIEYPRSFKLWLYYSIFNGAIGDRGNAIMAVQKASEFDIVPDAIMNNIQSGKSFSVPILGKEVLIK